MKQDKSLSRRAFVRLCVGTGAAVTANPRLLADAPAPLKPTQTVVLVDASGEPMRADQLRPGINYVFNYPYVSTPCFLIDLGRSAPAVEELETEDGRRYEWKGGVGPARSIVAFSAICAHRMSYPTRDISFISYRNESVRFMDRDRNARRKEQVIYCCSEGSVYDPAEGGRVLGGPAPQPLAAVDLTCGEDGTISACGTYGGDMFERFFENFAFQLSLIHGTRDFQDPAEGTSVVMPLEEYTRNQRIC
jgi:arsenite oxidase small subunit